MLLAGQKHLSSGVPGRAQDIDNVLDGRALEKWFMKTICGAVAGKLIDGVGEVPQRWIEGLFAKGPWPEEWAFHLAVGARVVRPADAAFNLAFHWTPNHQLNGVIIKAFAFETLFALVPPEPSSDLIRRPPSLSVVIRRPDGGDILDGLPAGRPVQFQMTWD